MDKATWIGSNAYQGNLDLIDLTQTLPINRDCITKGKIHQEITYILYIYRK